MPKELKLGDYAVLQTIIYLQKIHKTKKIQTQWIAEALKTSDSTVQKHLNTLEAEQVIQREGEYITVLNKNLVLVD
ncbi:MAG: DeoR family transcriptional regulator [Candidatus Woesearchaeota archaeon]